MGCGYWLILSCFLFQFCHADDTLLPGQSVRNGQTLVSTGGNFTLGFFSPGSSQKWYVGIWFSKVPVQTPVWVANRENSLTDSSGALEIGDDGNLMVLNGAGSSIWSSNASGLGSGTNSTAKLLNTGNMILSDANSGMVLWQSFDHPSNTVIEGMKIGLNLKSGENQLYTSWKNPNDPSPGNFSFGVDPRGTPQVFVWNGFTPHWRTGQWKGKTFNGIPQMPAFYLAGFDLIRDNEEGKLYFTFSNYNSSSSFRLVIDDSGQLQLSEWVAGMEDWKVWWADPIKDCDIYNRCGTFGMCSDENLHGCNCLKGFEPRFPQDRALGNWSTGCVRRTQLACEDKNGSYTNWKADGFLRLERMKLPDSNDWLPAIDTSSCKSECMKNCSCVAFTYLIGSGCMVWGGDLVDLRQFSEGGDEFYIRLAASELVEKKRAYVVIIIAVVIGIAIMGACVWACIYFMWCKVKPRESPKKERSHNLMLFDLSHGEETSINISNSNKSDEVMNGRNGPKFPIFDLAVISNATDDFCYKNKLGEGGFGPVYKGTLNNGREIAVKRLSKRSGQGVEEFKNEVVLMAKLQHRNLVRLLGCCIQGEEKMLIYEYMPNKSLDAFLFDSNKRSLLDWGKRFQIIEGIARGLLYLHRDSPLRIIHRDLKPSNILLDGDMNPKISDFGMARIFGGNQTQANTNRVVGTYGYMSPEYAMRGFFSVKSDVFSFGVLLLEIVSGRRNTSFYQSEHSLNLIEYAWRLWSENNWVELMDPSLGGSCPAHEVLKCIHVGLLCVQENVADRPTMASIVSMMEKESTTRPVPKQPSFYSGRRVESSPESNLGVFSLNDVTITMVNGR